ncbi:DMT family transporter [Alicyclobacillus mengziensis]|uniref:DMT family transporter n=1 Tax=Alicyclobacillus mengziensis TaxID=2931921 RepID=A0A9X7Z5R6_9BACL|nr:DMT family transporter [Alicyclobacillus mengziensis]QSO45545.1 DMT family transporter [Alicyclobacillus mengziensis]
MSSILSMFNMKQEQASGRYLQHSRLWPWLSGMTSIILVTAIWGYSNVVMRQGEGSIAPTVLMWMRFGVAGVLMLPALIRIRLSWKNWTIGLATGFLLGISVLAQCWAMLSIPVDEVAFITALYVVFTPLAMAIIQRTSPSMRMWMAILLSFIGVALLIGKLTLNLHVGAFWALVAAIGLSGQIIFTTYLANTLSSIKLASLQSVGAGLTLTAAVLVQGYFQPSVYHGLFHWTATEWYFIGFLAVMGTVVAVFMQAFGQARISATDAALAFNMEPVWTVVFAWAILRQGMSVVQAVGAVLIVSSLMIVSTPKKGVQ